MLTDSEITQYLVYYPEGVYTLASPAACRFDVYLSREGKLCTSDRLYAGSVNQAVQLFAFEMLFIMCVYAKFMLCLFLSLIRGLMITKLPVRRLSHVSPSRTWDLVRREIETYALMFPNVAFTLEDAGRSTEPSHHKERIIRIPKVCLTRTPCRL